MWYLLNILEGCFAHISDLSAGLAELLGSGWDPSLWVSSPRSWLDFLRVKKSQGMWPSCLASIFRQSRLVSDRLKQERRQAKEEELLTFAGSFLWGG